MKTDKELADDLDAKKRMQEHGYRQETCRQCNGLGLVRHSPAGHPCIVCDGKGYHWRPPLTCVSRKPVLDRLTKMVHENNLE